MSFHGFLAGAGAIGIILMVVVTILLVLSAIYLGFGMRRAAIAHEEHTRAMWAIAQALARSASVSAPEATKVELAETKSPSFSRPPDLGETRPQETTRPPTQYMERATLTKAQLDVLMAVFVAFGALGVVLALIIDDGWWILAILGLIASLVTLVTRIGAPEDLGVELSTPASDAPPEPEESGGGGSLSRAQQMYIATAVVCAAAFVAFLVVLLGS